MIFAETKLPGAFVVDLEERVDERGFFARSFCLREFADHGIELPIVQCNVSFNRKRGTLRGLHFQAAPHAEAKLVRCTRGAIWDVIVDLRPDSPTHLQWTAVEMTETNHRMLYIPKGFAHGFQTLADDTEVFYHMSEFYCPEASRGLPWDDPAFAIDWPPCAERTISQRDQSFVPLQALSREKRGELA